MTIEQFLENTKYIRGIEVRSDLKTGGGGGGTGRENADALLVPLNLTLKAKGTV